MKLALTAGLAGALLMLGACAGTMGPDRYRVEMDKLERDCAASGGILQTTGQSSGQASLDYACRLTSATRIPPAR